MLVLLKNSRSLITRASIPKEGGAAALTIHSLMNVISIN
jgi:hypothetical protein